MTDAVAAEPPFDVVVIGGGIIGCGIARDAALRGLKVALVEKHDFGSGTTAGSTRLIHGGLRYLATGDFGLVRMDLRERETLLRIAPHLVKPLPFLLPLPKGFYGRTRLRIGMHLYDALSYDKTLPSHRILSPDELRRVEPGLDSVALPRRRAVLRLPVRVAGAPDARERHRRVRARRADPELHRGRRRDSRRRSAGRRQREEGARPASPSASCAAASSSTPAARGSIASPRASSRRRRRASARPRASTSRASRSPSHAIFLESAVDGRAVFAIPWMGHTWIGTTDTDFDGDPSTASATDEDVRYLIESVRPQLPAAPHCEEALDDCAGVRALVRTDGSPSGVSRMHHITTETSGLVSVIGGKLTGYRAIAEEVVDGVCRSSRCPRGRRRPRRRCQAAVPGDRACRIWTRFYGRGRPGSRRSPTRIPRSPGHSPGHPDIAAEVV